MDISKLVETVKLFVNVEATEMNLFMEQMEIIQLKKHEIWDSKNKIGTKMGFINKGILRQYYEKEEEEFIELFYTEGDFFGSFASYLKQEPSRHSVEALEDCEILAINFVDLEKMYDLVPASERFARKIAELKLIELHDRLSSFLMDSPTKRYQDLIAQKPDLINRIPQYYIAQYLGIKPQSLSRIRSRKK